ncbi:hypothetical protein T4C_12152 [Trichinella pseudospiralis]|uniref:Uncharacterized protein n=2 Tax=Trichinella pseudospiralis TaxID=6337 RepID=A0A0V1F8M1_TRIPS|nr:hypothetical protein T4D_8612 [Trichinella pseudospiralis]KRY89722.1 hypothetical protein T4D_6030 [Trichinella pseudospiralis]KRZ29677.1 hypothetical protein T4C_12152 [Trichinella pseudospiralis]
MKDRHSAAGGWHSPYGPGPNCTPFEPLTQNSAMPGFALPHCVGEPVLCLLYPDFCVANGWLSESSVHCVRTQYSPPFHRTPLANRRQLIAR